MTLESAVWQAKSRILLRAPLAHSGLSEDWHAMLPCPHADVAVVAAEALGTRKGCSPQRQIAHKAAGLRAGTRIGVSL